MGVAGFAGGARFTSAAVVVFAGAIFCNCCRGIGSPGCCASACWRAANGGGEGGGAALAMTARLAMAWGGAAMRLAVFACAPRTAAFEGGIAALTLTGAEAIC